MYIIIGVAPISLEAMKCSMSSFNMTKPAGLPNVCAQKRVNNNKNLLGRSLAQCDGITIEKMRPHEQEKGWMNNKKNNKNYELIS